MYECQSLLTLGTHAHEGYSTHFVYECVCLPSASAIKLLYGILSTATGFLLSLQDFQLTDFSKMTSFRNYSLFFIVFIV